MGDTGVRQIINTDIVKLGHLAWASGVLSDPRTWIPNRICFTVMDGRQPSSWGVQKVWQQTFQSQHFTQARASSIVRTLVQAAVQPESVRRLFRIRVCERRTDHDARQCPPVIVPLGDAAYSDWGAANTTYHGTRYWHQARCRAMADASLRKPLC